jgi:hypothetical protein
MVKSKIDDLYAELEGLERRLAHTRQQHAEAVAERKTLARGILNGDKAALKRDRELADATELADRTVQAATVLRGEVEQPLQEAETVEAETLRAAKAKAAEKFAAVLAERGAVLDRALETFREEYKRMRKDLDEARSKGLFHISSAQIEAVSVQSFRNALWQMQEFDVPPPDIRKSFESYTKSWSEGVIGTAKRILSAPIAVNKAAEKPASLFPSALGGPVSDDELTIYETKADADRAHQEMQKGPQP